MNHHRILWIAQWIFGFYFLFVGINHFLLPDGLPSFIGWMYELSDAQHTWAGTAEILGGIGLVLPSLTKIQPRLTVLAALGLIVVMILAIVWHVGREEWMPIGSNVFNILVLSYIAYGRSRLAPISD